MGEENVLAGGTEILLEIRGSLQELENNKSRAVALKTDEVRLEKEIQATEKSMNTDIANTVTKRRKELEASYNGQISSVKANIEKEKTKRDKEKSSKVSERIGNETENLRKDILSLKQNMKQIFDKNRIPKIFNNDYFFALFMPNGIKDVLVLAASFAAVILIPLIIFLLFIKGNDGAWWKGLLLFGGFIGIFGVIYGLIFSKIRVRHKTALKSAQTYRSRIDGNKRRIKKIENEIRKDSDESLYNLEEYDERIGLIERRLDDILEDKKEALADFEDKKKLEITEDIKAKYAERLNKSKEEYERNYKEQEEINRQISEATVRISKNYEAYVGKDALNITTIDQLIEMIESGNAISITDALDRYKKNMINE